MSQTLRSYRESLRSVLSHDLRLDKCLDFGIEGSLLFHRPHGRKWIVALPFCPSNSELRRVNKIIAPPKYSNNAPDFCGFARHRCCHGDALNSLNAGNRVTSFVMPTFAVAVLLVSEKMPSIRQRSARDNLCNFRVTESKGVHENLLDICLEGDQLLSRFLWCAFLLDGTQTALAIQTYFFLKPSKWAWGEEEYDSSWS